MPRIARVVISGVPHHVTQRGVRSLPVFFGKEDRRTYLRLLAEQGKLHGVRFLAYCLMSNHVHLVAVPSTEASLARAIGEAHRRYTRWVNLRQGVRGYLFQGRFYSCPLDEVHLLTAVHYIEHNPVRAGMVKRPWDHAWSSARFHVGRRATDALVEDRDLIGLIPNWREFLNTDRSSDQVQLVQSRTRTGRPCGDRAFIKRAERITRRKLTPNRRGRPRRAEK
ncbi:MAG: transposase [Planctomycetota bacterium]